MNKRQIIIFISLFATCFLIYLVGWSGHFYSIDGMITYQFSKQMTFSSSYKFSPPLNWGGVEIPTSKWAVGLSLVYIPILWLLSFLTKNPALFKTIPNPLQENYQQLMFFDPGYRLVSIIQLGIVASIVACTYLLATKLIFSEKTAIVTALIVGILSPITVYSRLDFAQPLAGLFLILSFIIFISAVKKHHLITCFFSALFMAFACLTRVEFFFIAAPLPILVILFKKDLHSKLKTLLTFTTTLIFALIFQLWFNYLRFDNLFQFGYSPISEFNFEVSAIFQAFLSLLINPQRGLWIYFPISLFAVANILITKRNFRDIEWGFLWMLFVPLFFYSCWRDWHAGFSWGPRFLIPFVPYWTIAAMNFISHTNFFGKKIFTLISVILGGIATVQGFFFNRFSAAQSLFDIEDLGAFFSSMPYFYRLYNFFDLSKYESFWIKQLQIGWGERSLFFIFITIVAILSLMAWTLWLTNTKKTAIN